MLTQFHLIISKKSTFTGFIINLTVKLINPNTDFRKTIIKLHLKEETNNHLLK